MRLLIIGSGGFGRELFAWIKSSPKFVMKNNIQNISFLSEDIPEIPVLGDHLGSINNFQFRKDDRYLCAIGSSLIRKEIVEKLRNKCEPLSFIHDSVIKGSRVRIGKGSIICPGVVLTSNIEIGDCVQIHIGSMISHDDNIADYATISPGCTIAGNVFLDQGVFLGVNVSIIPGIKIGKWSLIGAGSTVVRNIPHNKKAYGNPAKIR